MWWHFPKSPTFASMNLETSATQDLDDNARFLREEMRKNALLQAIPDLIFLMSQEGEYVDFRGGQGRAYIDQAIIIGSNIHDSDIPKDIVAKILAHNNRAIETGEVGELEYSLTFENGEVHHYESRSMRYSENLAVRIVRDMTDHVNAQREVTDYMRRLEEFAFITSHELRQPVANILGLTSLFSLELLPAEERKLIGHIAGAAQNLDSIIHRLQEALNAAQITERDPNQP